ncbi:flagellar motor protein MotB [Planktotalea sp.]|uniref:flagellar motor protein MotB n=1 Tax=Planktotalea sp. TaxID=2029877 RepID=UPI003F6B4802
MSEAIEAEIDDNDDDDECPKCPPVGAPAWMATFADLAILLMAFFVLILSFAEMNVPKFKQISGSLRDSFGIQRIVPVVEQPEGTTILELNFSPSPSPSITEEATQETTEVREPEVKVPTDNRDNDGKDNLNESDENREGLGGKNADGAGDEKSDAEKFAEAIEKIGASVNVSAELVDGKVAVNLNAEQSTPEEMIEKFQRVAQALEIAELATGNSENEVLYAGLDTDLSQLIGMVSVIQDQKNAIDGESIEEDKERAQKALDKAREAEAKLKANLENEIENGLVTVERREGKVFVNLGSGGAFPSGSASLTGAAQAIVAELAATTNDPDSSVVVAGHTDNVPIGFGALYRDNWDLAAARAASVVQEIEGLNLVPEREMSATSYGEARPIADNDTPEGREKNRRIEIEIEFKQ